MQTSKSKANPIEIPARSSPKTPKTTRQSKTPGSGSEQVLSSPNKANRANKVPSPKVSERRMPQSPILEKKRETKGADLESKIVQLQEDLKQARDNMVSSELLKEQAELEAEDAKKQLSAMNTKLEDTEKQLMEISGKDGSLVQELCNMSQDGDTKLESELEVVHKQNSPYSADQGNPAPAGSACDELCNLRTEHEKAVARVEKLEVELNECKKSEVQVLEELNNTRSELEAVKEENKTLTLGNCKALEDNSTMVSELEESKAKVDALEMLVSKLQSNLVSYGDGMISMNEHSADNAQQCEVNGHNEKMEQLKSEIMNLKYEDCKLRTALEAAEMRYQDVMLQSTLDVRSAYEQAESTNLILRSKEAELQKANSDITELQAKLADLEKRMQTYAENDQRSQLEIRVTELQETLLNKDILLQEIEKQNESLKQQLMEVVDGSGADSLMKARAAEQKAINKLEYLTEESDKNSKRTARVIEQLDAAQAANAELESELRKLKVQSDQWRKAAEAAAAMLTSGNNGKYIDRTGSLDSGYHTLGGRISSPFSDDLNDESVKKKNGNMLKKIGVLWKKGQNQK